MRELEFIPSWYPQLRRRRRMVVLQGWATVVVGAGLGLWLFLAHGNTERRRFDHDATVRELSQSRSDLRELNAELDEKHKLEAQQRIVDKLGTHVEVTRLLARLDEIMPKEMTLMDASFNTLEQAKPSEGKGAEITYARKLLVHLAGVTPSDADWAGVLAKLSSVPFFQEVRLVGAHDKFDSGHLMREFEVSFVVDLGNGG